MRTRLLFLLSFFSFFSFAQDISEYFYPFITYSYSFTPNGKNENLITNYKLANAGKMLVKTTEVYQGLYASKVAEDDYLLSSNTEESSITSSRQAHADGFSGRSAKNDIITMFALPSDDKEFSWEETQNNLLTKCTANNIFLSFILDGNPQYRKGVKLIKSWDKEGKHYVQTSFWVKRLSRLITLLEVDGAEPFTNEILVSYKISDIKEISEEEYNLNH